MPGLSKKKGYKATTADFVINTGLFTVALASISALNVTLKNDSPFYWTLPAGSLIASLLGIVQRNGGGFSRGVAEFARDIPSIVTTKDGNQYLKFKDDRKIERHEFHFEGYGLPIQLPYSTLEKFVGLAKSRQEKSRYRAGVGGQSILSKGYYCKKYHRPFTENEYLSCMDVLLKLRRVDLYQIL